MAADSSSFGLLRNLHPMRDVKPICAIWLDAWERLSSHSHTRCVAEGNSNASQELESFQRRIWALVDISLTNRHSEEIEKGEKNILAIIKRMPPSHTPLSNGQFRLLRLQQVTGTEPITISLTNVSMEESLGSYNAISYCWGPPTQSRKIVILDGRPFLVSDTLLTLLYHFSRDAPGYYWLDALCIRQDDIPEKNMQIPLMGRIYSNARFVDIWLGSDEKDSEYVLKQLLAQDYANFGQLRFLKGLRSLLRRPWFKRLWVVQELVLAGPQAPVLRSGFVSCPWERFAISIEALRDLPKDFEFESAPQKFAFRVLILTMNYRTPATLPTLLISTRQLQATDPRDKVYGVLGIASTGLAPGRAVDYKKSMEEVFFDATITVIQENPELYIMTMYSVPFLPTIDSFDDGFPSWTLDFSLTGMTWADKLWDDEYIESWLNSNTVEGHLRLDLAKYELEVSASIVDDIAWMVECPINDNDVLYVTDWDEIQEQRVLQKTDFLNFMVKIQRIYELSLEGAKKWVHGEREPLWEILKDTPQGRNWEKSHDLKFSRQECSEKYDILVSDNQIDPTGTWIQGESLSLLLEAIVTTYEKEKRRFFMTKQGLCGFCMLGAQIGDTISVLALDQPNGPDIPIVIRPREDGRYSMTSVAWVPKNWKDLSKFRGTLEPQPLVFR
ncbi:Nn.00g040020.m01.CDS01 [Neocucurbitaria sp. VM-36]